ncbi:putative membrane protein [Archaeoglobus sulfaticallidus PM70-1]|uniref:Putative membrane protein n=1 Tax=Archaeoglobus sulfaticallidus PM70-1 TaxID=387631 RepID=N0BBI7_9EURY|nr:DUF2070 family protein [Archaeoglobus sulfaticallidus]AGK60373.1 putative membrane protein [Archaeoglobus sulfaticallidus PM70-1]
MIDQKIIEKFYSKLFTIPRKRVSVLIGIITIVFASFLNGTVSKSFFAQRYFFIGLSLIISLLIASKLLKIAFNSRRVFFLALFILIFVEIFDSIAIHILHNFNLIIMAPSAMATGLTLILFFTSETEEFKASLLSTTILLSIYPIDYAFSFEAPHRFTGYVAATVIGVSLALLFIKFIDRNYGRFNSKRLLRNFILFWLTSDPSFFERELERISETKEGFVKCLKINDVHLVTTSFHPGPIRNIGGALLVEKLLDENRIYLHSLVKHDSNPSTSRDVEEIVRKAKNLSSFISLKCFKPVSVEGERFKLMAFPFDKLTLIFISGKKAIDDIPESINRFAEKIFGECIVVDCHNCHSQGYEMSSGDIIEILELMEALKEKIDFREVNRLRYSLASARIDGKSCERVSMLILDYDGERFVLLMLDGNNINCEFKSELENFFLKSGLQPVIFSTDNHSKTGVSPKIGYMPVGSDVAERKAIIDFIMRNLGRELKDVGEVGYSHDTVKVRVMGEDFFKAVEKMFVDLGEKAIYIFISIVLIQFFTSLIFGNLILLL